MDEDFNDSDPDELEEELVERQRAEEELKRKAEQERRDAEILQRSGRKAQSHLNAVANADMGYAGVHVEAGSLFGRAYWADDGTKGGLDEAEDEECSDADEEGDSDADGRAISAIFGEDVEGQGKLVLCFDVRPAPPRVLSGAQFSAST